MNNPKLKEFIIEDLVLDYDDIYISELENLGMLNPLIDPIKADIKENLHKEVTSKNNKLY